MKTYKLTVLCHGLYGKGKRRWQKNRKSSDILQGTLVDLEVALALGAHGPMPAHRTQKAQYRLVSVSPIPFA